MRIETGMYVRTKDGVIAKVKTKTEDSFVIVYKSYDFYDINNVTKASYNIIDLIEEGDYVNGYLVDYVRADNNNKKWVYLGNNHTYNLCNEEIKSIVTHEQFESIKYEV